MKKFFSVVLCVLMVLTPTVGASATSLWTPIDEMAMESLRGSSPISASEAKIAYQNYYGLDSDTIDSMLVFVEETEYNFVSVWSNAPADEAVLYDVVTYDDSGYLCSCQGWTIAPTDETKMLNVVSAGVDSAFDIASIAFIFLLNNPLMSIMLGVGFGYTAFNLIRKGIRTAKRT